MCVNADLTAEISRCVLLVKLRSRRYSSPLYKQPPTVPLRLKVRMLKADIMETMPHGLVTWVPTVAHLAILPTAHHRLLLRCIAWNRKPRDGYHMLSYADAPAETVCQNVETTVRKRIILFAWFVARVGIERLPKRVTFGELEREKGYSGGLEQDWMCCLERDVSLFNLPIEEKNSGRWQQRNRAM